ncbi:hypothetical protein SNEBB_002489 [Seison nebaliae]|nr:hypothetical protein SNEBB_002489 [Seison nebaliae]
MEMEWREGIYRSKFCSKFNERIRSIITRNKIEKDASTYEDVWHEIEVRKNDQQLLTSMPLVIDKRRAVVVDLMNLKRNGMILDERLKGKIALYFGEDIRHNHVLLNIYELCFLSECGYILPFYGSHQLSIEELFFKLFLNDHRNFLNYFIFSFLQRHGFVVLTPSSASCTSSKRKGGTTACRVRKMKKIGEWENDERKRERREIRKLLERKNVQKKFSRCEFSSNSNDDDGGDENIEDDLLFHLYNKSQKNFKKSQKDNMKFTGHVLHNSPTNYIHLSNLGKASTCPTLLPLTSTNFSTITFHFLSNELAKNK